MKKSIRILAFALVMTLSVGCLERQFSSGTPTVTLSKREILVPSDIKGGRNLVKGQIVVTSNISWTAELPEDVDWISMPKASSRNLSGTMLSSTLELSFCDNETSEERSANITIHDEKGSNRVVLVRQKPISCYCELTVNPYDLQSIRAEGGMVDIPFITNTAWRVSVNPGATLGYEMQSDTEGRYSGMFSLYVKPNDGSTSKSAVFVLSADNCEDVEITICQVEK